MAKLKRKKRPINQFNEKQTTWFLKKTLAG